LIAREIESGPELAESISKISLRRHACGCNVNSGEASFGCTIHNIPVFPDPPDVKRVIDIAIGSSRDRHQIGAAAACDPATITEMEDFGRQLRSGV
jgi:hypothetical protein